MTAADLSRLLQPQNELEASFLEDPDFVRGLQWGQPRYGHPEGSIWRHIIEVNANIDRLPERWLNRPVPSPGAGASYRDYLRICCWVHDTFKNIEDRSHPRDYNKHHSIYARAFLTGYLDDPLLLNLVELHDEAYYIWRLRALLHQIDRAEQRLIHLRRRMGNYWQLYYLFFKCDTCTGDKNPAPLRWFEQSIDGIDLVKLKG